MSSATGYQLDVNLVPYINSFNIAPEEPYIDGPTGPNQSFRYNTIFIDIKDKKIISDIDIYTNNINGQPLQKKVYTSTATVRISDEFDQIFNLVNFKSYIFDKFKVSDNPGQMPYTGVNNPTNQENPYSIENYINRIEFSNVSIDLQTVKSAVSMPLQIRFDTTTYHHIPEHTTDACAMPERNNVTASSKNVAPLVYYIDLTEIVIFDLRRFMLTAQKYAMQKFNRFKYIFNYNPFQYAPPGPGVVNGYKYLIYPSNGTYYFTETVTELHYILVGGGGAGGRGGADKLGKTPIQGGGAGGYVVQGMFNTERITPNCLLSVTIGLGAEQGKDETNRRNGASGNASSFIITDQNGRQLVKKTAVGGQGGAGGNSGGGVLNNEPGRGGGWSSAACVGRGGDFIKNRISSDETKQAVKQDVTFNDGGNFEMSIASGGGGGGYIAPALRDNFITPPDGLNGVGMLGGLGVENSNEYSSTQNGKNMYLGTFLQADYPMGLPSGSGGAGGGFAGGSGSNGIAIFYFRPN